MDPSATYEEMCKAYTEARWEDAIELAENLLTWIHHGGYIPCGLEREKCLVHCRKAISKARKMLSEADQSSRRKPIETHATGEVAFPTEAKRDPIPIDIRPATDNSPVRWWAPEPVEPEPTPAAPTGTKPCPFCAEPIQAAAKKCKHCSEFLDPSLRAVAVGNQMPMVNQSVVVNTNNDTYKRERVYYEETFDHLPHIILSFFTLGFWIPIWIICRLFWTPRQRIIPGDRHVRF